jgi:6-phosphogluconolactonase
LEQVQRIASIPEEFTDLNTNADIHADPDGNFLYVSNRGHNSLAIYTIDESGLLAVAGFRPTLGERPRNFLIDHSGSLLFVANRNSDHIKVFGINSQSGLPEYTGKTVDVPGAVCIKMLRLSGNRLVSK